MCRLGYSKESAYQTSVSLTDLWGRTTGRNKLMRLGKKLESSHQKQDFSTGCKDKVGVSRVA